MSRTAPLRWRKGNSHRFGPNQYDLYRGDEYFATAQSRGGYWFWYGMGQNTCNAPTSLAECKKAAAAFAKDYEARMAAGRDAE